MTVENTAAKPKLHENDALEGYRKGENYTDEDDKNVKEIITFLNERKHTTDQVKRISQAALARMARIGVSTLSQILSGAYNASPSKILVQVINAIRHNQEDENNLIPAVETTVFKMVQTACVMARRHRNFSVMSAYVGTGKTFSLKYYVDKNANTFMIEADPTMTPQTIVKELAKKILGPEFTGTNYELLSKIIDELKDTDSLLIIDEAETLTPKQLHIIRRIRDKANIGVVLSGTEYLKSAIEPVHGQFDQIRSRTGFWPEVITRITRADGAALIQAGFPEDDIAEDIIDRLMHYCQGSARMLVEGLIAAIHQYRKNHALSVELVNKVAETALCLK